MIRDYNNLLTMQQQPQETVQLFFNGNNSERPSENNQEVYKNYILKQNSNLMSENKQLEKKYSDLEKKYTDLEEESGIIDKRLNNTKNYLKNFRFINESLEKVNKKFNNFNDKLRINHMVNELRIFFGSLSIIMIILNFMFSTWMGCLTMLSIYCGFIYIIHELTFIPNMKNIEVNRKKVLEFKKIKDRDIQDMKRTMDIISTFVDDM